MTQLVGKYSICFLLYHACLLTERKAFLSMEIPQIQIYNPFYFLMKLIGELLCKKNLAPLIGENVFTGFSHLHTLIIL